MVLVEQVRADAASAPVSAKLKTLLAIAAATQRSGHSVEIELVALDVLHHEARLVVAIGRQ